MGAFTGLTRMIRAVAVAAALTVSFGQGAEARGSVVAAVDAVRVGTYDNFTRVLMHVNVPVSPKLFTLSGPDRLVIDLPRIDWRMPRLNGQVRSRLIHSYRFGLLTPSVSRLVFNLTGPAQIVDFQVTPLANKVGYELDIQLRRLVSRPLDPYRLANDQVYRADGTQIPGATGALPEAPVVDDGTRDTFRQRRFDPATAEYGALGALFAGADPVPPAPAVEDEALDDDDDISAEVAALLARIQPPLEVVLADDDTPAAPPVPATKAGPVPEGEGAGGKVAAMAMAAPGMLSAIGGADAEPAPRREREHEPFRIVIDPGHGGRDPGAGELVGLREASAVLAFSEALMALLEEDPEYEPFATRREDVFVELPDRVSFAREKRADLFISIHADWFDDETVSGAGAYMLSEEGSIRSIDDLVTAKEAGTVAGIDLREEREDVVRVLLDLERRETQTGSRLFAEMVRDKLSRVTPLKRNFVKHDNFHVLRVPDMPSILLELGFMSNAEDRERLASPEWRRATAAALKAAIDAWRIERSVRDIALR